MFNLPFNSSIGGNAILHEGNHDKRGIPHEQYINKWNLNTTLDNKTNTNKYSKIAEIEYEEDNNTSCNYIIEIVNSRDLTMIDYLYLSDYILLYLILVLMSYLISVRFCSKLFKNSAMKSYREEV